LLVPVKNTWLLQKLGDYVHDVCYIRSSPVRDVQQTSNKFGIFDCVCLPVLAASKFIRMIPADTGVNVGTERSRLNLLEIS
jgi:hypothetical protein